MLLSSLSLLFLLCWTAQLLGTFIPVNCHSGLLAANTQTNYIYEGDSSQHAKKEKE